MGLNLSEESVAALESRTEGWVAGLQLAALALRAMSSLPTQRGVADFLRDFGGTHRYVIDYLAEEVLRQQSEEMRTFLHQTAILDRLCAPLCDELTGRDDSEAILRRLEAENLFLIPLDVRREWYRYHHLFADFLRTELDEKQQPTLHLRAAHWLMEKDLWVEAANHALASGEMQEAAGIIALGAAGAVRSASFVTLLSWLEALPDELVRANGELATHKGFLLFLRNDHATAAIYADAAGKSLPLDAPSPSRGRLLSLQVHVAMWESDLDSVVELSRAALRHLGDEDYFFRDLTFNVLGQSLEMQGDVAAAVDVYREAVQIGRRAGGQQSALVSLTNWVFALNELGRRREAVALCEQVLSESRAQRGGASPLIDGLDLGWGLLSCEANELDRARRQALRALALCERVNIVDGILWAQHILTRVHLAGGEVESALDVIQEARRLATSGKPHEGWVFSLEAEINLRRGNVAEAVRWAKASNLTPADTPHHWTEFLYFTYVRLLLAQDRLEEAGTLLATIERSAQEGQRRRKLITVYLLQALLLRAQGDEVQALSRVEGALRLAAPEDYYRVFLDEGPVISELLPRVAHGAPEFVSRLMQAFQAQTAARGAIGPEDSIEPVCVRTKREPSPIASHDKETLVEPLSERELQVLRLVARGLSNREIAQALVVTVGTVKKHLNNIFGKLSVKSRTQAVARARDLALLP
jgi:LuxR family maltose regulon positive regulatory protein